MGKFTHWRRYVLFGLVSVCALLVCTDLLWARAGGGGGFGGGGSGSGGGGGGGGDGLFFLIWLCFRYPAVGVPLLIVFGVATYYGGNTVNQNRINSTIRRGREAQHLKERHEALAALCERDPGFDEEAFLDRVEHAFVRLQEAWSNQDLSPARPFISDGIHQRFSLQIEMQKAQGIRNVMEDVEVLGSEVLSIHTGKQFDTLHVKIRASAVDYKADLATGKAKSMWRRPESFIEVWSFHRRPGARTLTRGGSMEGNCPKCAAPLKIVDTAKCGSCGATVNSGEHDWVLAEITQLSEWTVPQDNETVEGAAELARRDPGFSIQHVEDRVSVMFWRMRAAEFFGDVGYATPVLSHDLAEKVRTRIPKSDSPREFWANPAVGRVEIHDVQTDAEAGLDRIRVVVRWSGEMRHGIPNKKHSVKRDQSIYTHVFEVVRKSGVQSNKEQTFSSAGCAGCGAPIAVSEKERCEFCGTTLTDGSKDWVLERIRPYAASLAYSGGRVRDVAEGNGAAGNGLAAPGSDAELPLIVLARVMWSDGHVDPKERQTLMEIGGRRGLDSEQVETVIRSAQSKDVEIPVPEKPQQIQASLKQIVQAVMADGKVSRPEKELLVDYAKRLGLAAADLKLAIRRERRRRYQEARQALKQRSARA